MSVGDPAIGVLYWRRALGHLRGVRWAWVRRAWLLRCFSDVSMMGGGGDLISCAVFHVGRSSASNASIVLMVAHKHEDNEDFDDDSYHHVSLFDGSCFRLLL